MTDGSEACIYGSFVGLSWAGPRAVHGPGSPRAMVGVGAGEGSEHELYWQQGEMDVM